MKTPKIEVTTNYSLFKFYKSNREADHFAKIMASIGKRNLTAYNPIIVDENFRIIDGQNRYFACKELNLPICYVVVDDGSEDDIPFLNSTQKNWSLYDYVLHWAQRKNRDYEKLNQLVQMMKFPGFSIATMVHFFNKKSDAVRDGGFKFNDALVADILFADKICFTISNIKNRRVSIQSSSLARGSWLFVKHEVRSGHIDKEKFISVLEKRGHMIEKHTSAAAYCNMLTDVWNFHRPTIHKRPYVVN